MTDPPGQPKPRGRIPLHRSVIFVDYHAPRIIGWAIAALACTLLLIAFHDSLLKAYSEGVAICLRTGGISFDQGAGDGMAGMTLPTWRVDTFNPVATRNGALVYGLCSLAGMLLVWRLPRVPLPVAAWFSLASAVLLLATLVLYWRPLPILTSESFSGLWGKVTLGTALVLPGVWGMLVGMLPLPVFRVAVWGLAAMIISAVWSMLRLAFFLGLAQWAGVVWLPMGVVFGGTLMDCLVLIVCFGFTLEPAGKAWGGAG